MLSRYSENQFAIKNEVPQNNGEPFQVSTHWS